MCASVCPRRGRQEPHLGKGAQGLAEGVARDAVDRVDLAAERKLGGRLGGDSGGRGRGGRSWAWGGATAEQDSG
jgi:hypothetical protein